MNLKFLPFLCFLTTTPAFATEKATPELLLKLIRENGCQMTLAEADKILPKHGFTQAQTREIVGVWDEKGMLASRGFAGIALNDKGCKG